MARTAYLTHPASQPNPAEPGSSRRLSLTRVLFVGRAIARPAFVLLVLMQDYTRRDFDPRLQPLSELSLGDWGWVQVLNFVLAGVLNLCMPNKQETPSAALAVALAYHQAWTRKNVHEALRHVAEDIVSDAPARQLRGIEEYRPFLANFVAIVTGFDMIAALGDNETAVLVYDLHTVPVNSGLTCECFTVKDGHITRNRLIFDQTPYNTARQQSS